MFAGFAEILACRRSGSGRACGSSPTTLWRGLRSAGTFVGMRGVRHPPALTSLSGMAGLLVAFGTHLELGLEGFDDVYDGLEIEQHGVKFSV